MQQASHKKELLAKEAALQQHEWDHAIRYNNAIAQRERELAQHKKTAAQVRGQEDTERRQGAQEVYVVGGLMGCGSMYVSADVCVLMMCCAVGAPAVPQGSDRRPGGTTQGREGHQGRGG